MKIIQSTWNHGDEKTDEQHMLSMIHSMAGQLAQQKLGNWQLSRTATDSNYVMTEWTNGIIEVIAETWKVGGEPSSHFYTIRQAVREQ